MDEASLLISVAAALLSVMACQRVQLQGQKS